MLPPDHPLARYRVLGEIQNVTNNSSTPVQSKEVKKDRPKGLHQKTRSSVSLRSLGKEKDTDDGARERKEAKRRLKEEEKRLKKTNKSSTSLSRAFAKSSKSSESSTDESNPQPPKDKENTTPPTSAAAPADPPIWAEFSSRPFSEVTTTTTIPLNDHRAVAEEIARYTPQDYSPSKQRNFGVRALPSLHERPNSLYPPATGSTASFMKTVSRKLSNERAPLVPPKGENGVVAVPEPRQVSAERSRIHDTLGLGLLRRSHSEKRKASTEQPKEGVTVSKRGSRVMAAVAALNGKIREGETGVLDEEKINGEFEAMLVSFAVVEKESGA